MCMNKLLRSLLCQSVLHVWVLNGCSYVWNQIRHSWKIFCDRVLFKKIEHTLDIPAAWTDHHFFSPQKVLKTVLLWEIVSNMLYRCAVYDRVPSCVLSGCADACAAVLGLTTPGLSDCFRAARIDAMTASYRTPRAHMYTQTCTLNPTLLAELR